MIVRSSGLRCESSLWSDSEGVPYFLDAALVLAVLGFAATLAAARFHGEGRLF
jgi:multicomponent Na+:H+ antiporter subunit F